VKYFDDESIERIRKHIREATPATESVDRRRGHYFQDGFAAVAQVSCTGTNFQSFAPAGPNYQTTTTSTLYLPSIDYTTSPPTFNYDSRTGDFRIYNGTIYDFSSEYVYLCQVGGFWFIERPVVPTIALYTLSGDLSYGGTASASLSGVGTKTLNLDSGILTAGQKFASGCTGHAIRKKTGWFVLTSHCCPVGA